MKVKSNVKAGGTSAQHNQTVKCLRVKSSVRAGNGQGRIISNHKQAVARRAQ